MSFLKTVVHVLYDELLFGMQLVSAMAIASALRETGVKTARIILLVR